jgi:heterodisulfide reductase subunit C
MEKIIDLQKLDPNFKDEIASLPGGENIKKCFACGNCTASCPVREIEDKYNPRKIIRMALLGMKEEVLKSDFIWLCSTCYTCSERCPQEVKLTEVMNVIKNLAVKEGYMHPAYQGQIELIYSHGRLYEIDDFDNKKREKVGLPKISTPTSEIKKIFEMTKLKTQN